MSRGPALLVDGHVHCHPCFEPRRFLDAAAANLARIATRLGASRFDGALFLADTDRDSFETLERAERDGRLGPWHLQAGTDATSLVAEAPGAPPLLLIAGRQIPTAEGLEVLALSTRARYRPRRGFAETLRRVLDDGALAVVPWGFGKWWWSRGVILRACLDGLADPRFFLGDNGGRPAIGGTPSLLAEASGRGVRILAGSDPLPFVSEVERVGSYVSVLDAAPGAPRSGSGLASLLAAGTACPASAGELRPVAAFVRSQLRMQVRRWTSGSGP